LPKRLFQAQISSSSCPRSQPLWKPAIGNQNLTSENKEESYIMRFFGTTYAYALMISRWFNYKALLPARERKHQCPSSSRSMIRAVPTASTASMMISSSRLMSIPPPTKVYDEVLLYVNELPSRMKGRNPIHDGCRSPPGRSGCSIGQMSLRCCLPQPLRRWNS